MHHHRASSIATHGISIGGHSSHALFSRLWCSIFSLQRRIVTRCIEIKVPVLEKSDLRMIIFASVPYRDSWREIPSAVVSPE